MTYVQRESQAVASKAADAFLSTSCLSVYRRLICGTVYPKCYNTTTIHAMDDTTSTSTGFLSLYHPSMVCRSLCEELKRVCPTIVTNSFNCTSQTKLSTCSGDIVAAIDTYPSQNNFFSLPTFNNRTDPIVEVSRSMYEAVPCQSFVTPEAPTVQPFIPSTCIPLPPTSVCFGVLSYPITMNADTCLAATETTLDTRTWSSLSKTCRNALASYQCTHTYSKCTDGMMAGLGQRPQHRHHHYHLMKYVWYVAKTMKYAQTLIMTCVWARMKSHVYAWTHSENTFIVCVTRCCQVV